MDHVSFASSKVILLMPEFCPGGPRLQTKGRFHAIRRMTVTHMIAPAAQALS